MVLSSLGLIFGLLGFLMGAVSCIYVLSWRFSTHKVEYRQQWVSDTTTVPDIPPHIADQLPQVPVDERPKAEQSAETLDQFMRKQSTRNPDIYNWDLGE